MLLLRIGLYKPGIVAEENRVNRHLSLEQFCLCLVFFLNLPLLLCTLMLQLMEWKQRKSSGKTGSPSFTEFFCILL